MSALGIIFALLALVCWGIGDFLIQRTSRDYGVWPSIFCITAFGTVALFPFIFKNIPIIFTTANIGSLLILGTGTLVAALATFNALRVGKISIVEPILSFELPMTILLAVILLREGVTSPQGILMICIFCGILLLGYVKGTKAHHLLEKGALIALLAALLQAGVNFITGLSSQGIGPVETIWFVDVFVCMACVVYFTATQTWHTVLTHVRQYPRESLAVAIFDNAAWVAYSFATILIPISLAITLSEGYIILSILLGVFINKEKLKKHQWLGVTITLVSVLVLAYISS